MEHLTVSFGGKQPSLIYQKKAYQHPKQVIPLFLRLIPKSLNQEEFFFLKVNIRAVLISRDSQFMFKMISAIKKLLIIADQHSCKNKWQKNHSLIITMTAFIIKYRHLVPKGLIESVRELRSFCRSQSKKFKKENRYG